MNVGDETRIYHGRGRWGDLYYGYPFGEGKATEDYYAEVALATLPAIVGAHSVFSRNGPRAPYGQCRLRCRRARPRLSSTPTLRT